MADSEKYPKPSVTADIVVFTVADGSLKVLLIRRDKPPFTGRWSLPGGFVRIAEPLEAAALRVLKEKTCVKETYLEQLYTFGNPGRDPRGRVISVVYYVLADATKIRECFAGGESLKDQQWCPVEELPTLAFDHAEIIRYAVQRVRYKLEYTSVGLQLLPELFTLTDLQKLYETILNEKLDKRNFRKKILAMDILEETREYRKGQHRPAKFFRFRKTKQRPAFKRISFEG